MGLGLVTMIKLCSIAQASSVACVLDYFKHRDGGQPLVNSCSLLWRIMNIKEYEPNTIIL